MRLRNLIRRRPAKTVAKAPSHPFVAMLDGPCADYRSHPTFSCACGSTWFYMLARFDEDTRLPGLYLTDGMCAHCSSLVTLPTPIDKEIDHDVQ